MMSRENSYNSDRVIPLGCSSDLNNEKFIYFVATKLKDHSAREFLRELIIDIPDKLFYEIVADRLNIPLSKAAMQERRITDGEDREYYTIEYLADLLFLRIVSVKDKITKADGEMLTVRKYHNQALRLWRWIPVSKPVPDYVVNVSDLTPRIVVELKALDRFSYNYVIKTAVGRIFENIDAKGYHLNIARRLRVRVDR